MFLIFSANASGAWFGYAKMSGSISGAGTGASYSSSLRGSLRSSSGSAASRGTASATSPAAAVVSAGPGGIRAQTIKEEVRLFSPSEHRMAGESPKPFGAADADGEVAGAGEEARSPLDEAGELVKLRARTIGVPEGKVGWAEVEAEVEKEKEAGRAESAGAVLGREMKGMSLGASPGGREGADEDGIVRRDTLLSEAESRNKKLERIPDG